MPIRPVIRRRSPRFVGMVLCAGALFAITMMSAVSASQRPAAADTAPPVPPVTITSPTPGSVSVLDPVYGLSGSAELDPDATPAFAAAITDALAAPFDYSDGPAGPQAVVYVPAGSYRLNGLVLPSNVRLEIDAGAVLEPIVAPATLTAANPIQLIQLGTADSTNQVSNVSIVGVGSATGGLKDVAAPTYDGWDISSYFTVDLDPTDTGASNDYAFATLINVTDFLISNIYIVQNNTIPSCTSRTAGCPVNRGPYPMPTSARAAVVYKPSNQSGPPGIGPYYDPTDGTLSDLYSIHAPYGFGPTQITSGHDLSFSNLYSDGGTTLRLETDDASKKSGGEVNTVYADNIVGSNCNRAVALSAHRQANSDVHITNVTSLSCNNGLVQSADKANNSGDFLDTTIDQFAVTGGTTAQIPYAGSHSGLWRIGRSVNPVTDDPGAVSWSAYVTNFSCLGSFSRQSQRFDLNGAVTAPKCGRAGTHPG